ncbi:MAG: hypothetical protein AAB116_21440 [Candidatus Poribacteria bacterium]
MNNNDREILRLLANKWLEIATQPVMEERKRLWTALKDLHAERPMILFETWTLDNYVTNDELECEDQANHGMERHIRAMIRQAVELGDDIVLEPCWRIGWHINGTGYGVEIKSHHAIDITGGSTGYAFENPIKTPQDIDLLKPRQWSVNREGTLKYQERLNDIFGDILPVVLHGTTGMGAGLTGDLFRFIGNDRLMTWVYDEPEAIHRIMTYLRDDRLAYFDFLEKEKVLGLNNNSATVGSGSPGWTTALPQPDYKGTARLKDLWLGMESQETTAISPSMFNEFFLPYMADICKKFGLVYYGCCEPVHDRWDHIISLIPNVRGVSISHWCDMKAIAEMLGKSCVFSRKPRPAPISGVTPDFEMLKKDIVETLTAAKDCNLEIVFRDVYRINNDRPRLRKWADMVRSLIAG